MPRRKDGRRLRGAGTTPRLRDAKQRAPVTSASAPRVRPPRGRGRRQRRQRQQKQAVNPRRTQHLQVLRPSAPPIVVKTTGVLIRGTKGPLPAAFSEIRVTYGAPSLPYEATLLWKPGMNVSLGEIKRGFTRLLSREDTHQAWEMLAMLASQHLLASSAGSEAERALTLEAVGDLRLPVYDVRILWVRRTGATERVIASWARQIAQGADEQHAFLRALYTERAMLCTLPPGWHKL